jgi:hypothetical protein
MLKRAFVAIAVVVAVAGCSSPTNPGTARTISPSPTVTTPSPTAVASLTPSAEVPRLAGSLALREKGRAVGAFPDSGSADVTVHQVLYPVDGTAAARAIRDPDMVFAAVDLTICPISMDTSRAGYTGGVLLHDADDRVFAYWNVQISAVNPSLNRGSWPHPGSCARGWLTFEVPTGTTLRSVTYTAGGNGPGDTLVWLLRD